MNARKRLAKFLKCRHENVQQYTECCLDCHENLYSESDLRKAAAKEAQTEYLTTDTGFSQDNGW